MRRADEPTSRDGGRDGTHGTKGTDGTGEDVGAGGLLWAGGGVCVFLGGGGGAGVWAGKTRVARAFSFVGKEGR